MIVLRVLLFSAAALLASTIVEAGAAETPTRVSEVTKLRVEVIAEYPHDPAAFTQGLLWHEGRLYESTGQYGDSSLRRVQLESGTVEQSVSLSPELFGEGLARVEERLIQLTWRAGEAIVWDLDSFREIDRLRYEGEGWGLCFDGQHLVMSDGSNRLVFRDPRSLEIVRQTRVTLGDGGVGRLNELECAAGWIYANVYTTDWIVQIAPESGRVVGLIDASGLLTPAESRGVDVLNGIAYDAERQVFLLTGKLWPKIFVVRFVGQDLP